MPLRLVKLSAVLAVLCTVSALAQAPNPYGLPVSVENAKKAAAAALDEARKGNWKMAVAVVDTGGTLVYYEKMDNTQTGSADVAIEKARTAVRFKRPSKAFQDAVAGGGPGLRILGLTGRDAASKAVFLSSWTVRLWARSAFPATAAITTASAHRRERATLK